MMCIVGIERYDRVCLMIVKRFFEALIAQNSYLIGCGAGRRGDRHRSQSRRAAVHRCRRGGEPAITHVTETHIHADFVSGARELAHRTGARLCLSDEGDRTGSISIEHDRKLKHGDRMTIGNVAIDVLHTPGHTPEHLTFLITDGAVADQPIAAVTGDFVFVGDVGRPDLLEKAAKIAGTMESGREDVVEEPAAVSAVSRLAADLARPRRGLVVRQGHQRGAAQHARLRAAIQLGVHREIRSRVRRQRAVRPAGSAAVFRDHEAA